MLHDLVSRRPADAAAPPRRPSGLPGYAELHCASNFSFLTGASHPEELVARAQALGYAALAITDECSLGGVVRAHAEGTDLFFSVAAVADYTPEAPAGHKLKKSGEPLEIRLRPTVDILAQVAAMPGGPFCVGFAAESENLADYAQAKRRRKNIPMIVANLVQHAIGHEENEVVIYDDAGAHPLARAPKSRIAREILAHALSLYEARRAAGPHS